MSRYSTDRNNQNQRDDDDAQRIARKGSVKYRGRERPVQREGRYDNASYLVGYAAEFTLKARYCTRKSWADFPDNPAEARHRGAREIITHDLEELLKLSESERIATGSMQHIDWDRARDWSEQHRYRRVGSFAPDHVKAQIEETRKLCEELSLYEIVEKLWSLELEFSRLYGDFGFFGLVDISPETHALFAAYASNYDLNIRHLVAIPDVSQGWVVLMSAWWQSKDGNERMDEFNKRFMSALDGDLFALLNHVTFLHPRHHLIHFFNESIGAEHCRGYITKGNLVGCIPLPRAFIITSNASAAPSIALAPSVE